MSQQESNPNSSIPVDGQLTPPNLKASKIDIINDETITVSKIPTFFRL